MGNSLTDGNHLRLAVKAGDLVFHGVSLAEFVDQRLADQPRADSLVGEFPRLRIRVLGESGGQIFSRLGPVKSTFVPAEPDAAAVVCALEHKAVGQCVKIDLVEGVVDAEGWNHVALTDSVSHIFFYLNLIHEGVIKLSPVV